MVNEERIRRGIAEDIQSKKDIVRREGGLSERVNKERCACCGNVFLWEEMIDASSVGDTEDVCQECCFMYRTARTNGQTDGLDHFVKIYRKVKAFEAGKTTCDFCSHPVDINYAYCRKCGR